MGLFAAIVTLVAFGVVSGCGGDSASSSDQELTKAQFVRKANTICTQKGAQIKVEGGRIIRAGNAHGADVQARIMDQIIVPNLQAEIRELDALEGPAADRQRIDGIVAAIQQSVDRLRSAPPIDASSSFKETHPYRPGEELAAEYGLTACGHP